MGYAFAERSPVHRLYRQNQYESRAFFIGGLAAPTEFLLSLLVAGSAYAIYLRGILNAPQLPRYTAAAVIGAALIVVANYVSGLYRPHELFNIRNQVLRVIGGVSAAGMLILLFGFLLQISPEYSRGWAALWFLGNPVVLLLFRLALARWLTQQAAAGLLRRNVVLVGTGTVAKRVLNDLRGPEATDVTVRGLFHTGTGLGTGPDQVGGVPVLGGLDALPAFVRDNPAIDVVLAVSGDERSQFEPLLRHVGMLPVNVYMSPGEIAHVQPRMEIAHLGGYPMLNLARRPLQGWNGLLKRTEDLVLAGVLVLFFAPLMGLVALAVKLDSRGPVFFRQKRFGLNNRPFEIWKFRTMHVDQADATGRRRTVRGDPRVTRVGAFLRASSLDELPQLINVLRGEMSIVGPRAHPVAMMAGDHLYHEVVDDYIARHRVRPGITGLAQVSGSRGEIDTVEKARRRVELDLHYIENHSLWLDFTILVRTAICLLRDDDAY